MLQTGVVDGFLQARYSFFSWRHCLAVPKKFALSFAMAGLTGILAQVCFRLPFTPVPVTGQVLGVLLSGVFCGGIFGSVSQIIYVGLGALGVPWFAGGTAGSTAVFLGPSGGYFIGFILAPLAVGSYTDRYISARTFFSQLKFMLLGVGIIYFFGVIGLSLAIKAGLWETLVKGVFPFILIDLLKASLSAGISSSVLPKAPYNGELDRSKYVR